MQTAPRKPRADALRNRTRLVEAAKEILGQGGPEASLEAVARRAGVGIGTLYRHFPTREALFRAVYSHEVESLIALAEEMDRRGDAAAALRDWLHALVAVVATKRGMLGALAVVIDDESRSLFDEVMARMTAAVDRLLARAQETGQIRGDVGTDDLLQLFFGLCYARPPEPGWEAQVIRLLDMFLDGLAVRPH